MSRFSATCGYVFMHLSPHPFFPPLRPRYVVQVEHITWEVSNGKISLQINTFSYYTGVREGTHMYDKYFYTATILFNI